jgi:hypothetical protein
MRPGEFDPGATCVIIHSKQTSVIPNEVRNLVSAVKEILRFTQNDGGVRRYLGMTEV